MPTKVMVLLLAALFLVGIPGAQAAPWDTHYLVSSTITPSGGNQYLFEYDVTNVDQGNGPNVGLDGFYLQVPLTAAIINITNPPTYSYGGEWVHNFTLSDPNWGANATLQPGYQWLEWWGKWPPSVYPQGTTAQFSVELDNVSLGYNDAAVVTYWGSSYTGYEGSLQGPVTAAPLPPGVVLFATGLVGLGALRTRFKKA